MNPTNSLISRESIVQKLTLEIKIRKFVYAPLQSASGMFFTLLSQETARYWVAMGR